MQLENKGKSGGRENGFVIGTLVKWTENLGVIFVDFIEWLGTFSLFIKDTFRWMFKRPYRFQAAVEQMMEVGVLSFPVVLFTAIFSGMVISLQTFTGFKRFGAESMVGTVVALSMTRELGPVLTGLIVAGRAGSAMTASLGTMRVTEQIDALYTLATNPIKYLVVPRVIAATLMLPILACLSDVIGIFGGYIVAVFTLDANPVTYMERTFDYLRFNDISSGLIKASAFGFIISIVGCYFGFYTEGGAEGVGKATTRSVVVSFLLIFLANYILTAMLFAETGGGKF
ncbi:MAG: ABC transporter permease [Nitrospinota bacterium]|nr:ABC transporter permease [Nitrospinota bacterium]